MSSNDDASFSPSTRPRRDLPSDHNHLLLAERMSSERDPLLPSSHSSPSSSMLFFTSTSSLPDITSSISATNSQLLHNNSTNRQYVSLDVGQLDININSSTEDTSKSTRKRGRMPWLSVLLLPGRIAIGALTYIAGAGLARRSGLSGPLVITTGCASAILSQVLIMTIIRRNRKRTEDEDMLAQRAIAERMAWFDAIQAVGKIVDKFSNDFPTPAIQSVFVDASMLRMLHRSTAEDFLSTARSKQISQADVLENGRHYLKYSIATYGFLLLSLLGLLDESYNVFVEGSRGADVARYMLRLKEDDIIVSLLDGEGINVPRHFMAVDHTRKAIVVAIRGTNSISDIITDLICENAPFAGGYAHSGMKSAAESLYTSLLPTLRAELAKRPTFSLVVTGHSLGAGVAILLTKLLLMNGFAYVKCYAIAPCPIFGPMHKVDLEWSDALECFVHENDLVSKLCLASARKLAVEMEYLHQLPIDLQEKKAIIKDHEVEKLREVFDREKRIRIDPRENEVEQLYIPTHHGIHWLIPDNEDLSSTENATEKEISYGSYLVRPRIFDSILLTSNCIPNHFPQSYMRAFANLPLPPEIQNPPQSSNENFTSAWYSNELG